MLGGLQQTGGRNATLAKFHSHYLSISLKRTFDKLSQKVH
jgi:hypothetical protein